MSSLVNLKLPQEDPIWITVGRRRLRHLAMYWHHLMRSRRRWIFSKRYREEIERRAASHMQEIGVSPEDLARIAQKGIVQVCVLPPYLCAGFCIWSTRFQ
jgi:hypothetical protein